MSHPFDTAIALTPADGRVRGRTHPDWANMVGPFGGITAATLLGAVEQHPECRGEPLALTVNFLAPITEGDFDIAARPVRSNRTNQHWTIELSQDGDAKTTATAVFGIHRDTWSDTELTPPVVRGPEDLPPGGMVDVIAWIHNYDMRFVEGRMPDSDAGPSPSSATTLWVRDKRCRPLDHAALAALCDVFYPRVFLRRGHFVPSGTISVTMYFHADTDELHTHGSDYVLGTAHATRFSGGYFDQSAQIWSRTGVLLATSHQLVYFKS